MKVSTISELENWMSENGIKNTFTSNNRFVSDEGLGLEVVDGLYIWYFVERGERQNLEYFNSEKDAVEFVYEFLKSGEPY
ncbi:MAG: hypothetical protein U0T69_07760 [Chitinophagales bacterium]